MGPPVPPSRRTSRSSLWVATGSAGAEILRPSVTAEDWATHWSCIGGHAKFRGNHSPIFPLIYIYIYIYSGNVNPLIFFFSQSHLSRPRRIRASFCTTCWRWNMAIFVLTAVVSRFIVNLHPHDSPSPSNGFQGLQARVGTDSTCLTLQECCSRFETFYLAKHTGLLWW